MAATFYQPAFAALTRWWAPDHVRALTVVTLASTAFAPLTAALADHMSWRATYAATPRERLQRGSGQPNRGRAAV